LVAGYEDFIVVEDSSEITGLGMTSDLFPWTTLLYGCEDDVSLDFTD